MGSGPKTKKEPQRNRRRGRKTRRHGEHREAHSGKEVVVSGVKGCSSIVTDELRDSCQTRHMLAVDIGGAVLSPLQVVHLKVGHEKWEEPAANPAILISS